MDRNSQEKIIEKFSAQLVKLTERIPGNFNEKDVHEWRVEYKKVRAFLRMITASVPDHLPYMTDELKKIYKIAGSIRELQLFISSLHSNPDINIAQLPEYYSLLRKQLFSSKEEFIKKTDIFSFEKELARWLIMPTDYLSVDIVKKFLQQRITAIRLIMLAPSHDEGLHSIRKHLKDIIYDIKIFSVSWGITFPVAAWKNEKKLIEVTEALGDFNDRCTAMKYVQSNYADHLPEEEKAIILTLNAHWSRQKHEQQQQIIEKIRDLHLLPEVKEI